jgi:ABC-type transport system involved in multi-copper enzyme maturation permease subunit
MLWYKAWHESKSRFFYTLIGMVLVCGMFILSYGSWHVDPARMNFRGFVWNALYFRFFHAAWVFSTLFLALGGLRAEQQEGTVLFTVSLPARRWRILLARAAVCAGEAIVTAIVPAMSISAYSLLIGRSYPVSQSVEFALLLTAGGIVFFSFGILLSAFLGGGWVPIAIGVPTIAGIYTGSRSIEAFRAYNPQDLFSGAATVQAPAWALGSPLPWSAMGASVTVALVLLLVSIVITERLDF